MSFQEGPNEIDAISSETQAEAPFVSFIEKENALFQRLRGKTAKLVGGALLTISSLAGCGSPEEKEVGQSYEQLYNDYLRNPYPAPEHAHGELVERARKELPRQVFEVYENLFELRRDPNLSAITNQDKESRSVFGTDDEYYFESAWREVIQFTLSRKAGFPEKMPRIFKYSGMIHRFLAEDDLRGSVDEITNRLGEYADQAHGNKDGKIDELEMSAVEAKRGIQTFLKIKSQLERIREVEKKNPEMAKQGRKLLDIAGAWGQR